jgi:hypothetical protein
MGCLGFGPARGIGTEDSTGVSSWQNFTDLAGPAPSPRQGAASGYDPAPGAQYLLLFGGEGPNGLLGDTWLYRGGAWTNVTSTACNGACPPRLAYASMSYDPVDQSMLLVGGLTAPCPTACAETYNPTAYLWTGGAWKSTVPAFYSAFGAATAWDAVDRCLLEFGGTTSGGPANLGLGYGETTCFNATAGNWSVTSGFSLAPSARWGAAMTNTSTGIDLLFGGQTVAGPLNDTWEYYNGSWYPVTIGGPSPPARAYSALVESPAAALGVPVASDSAILFQGQYEGAPISDTWLFSGGPPQNGHAYGNWTEDASAPAPPAAWGPAGTSDLAASSAITFGGAEPSRELATTWAYFHPVVVVNSSASEFRATTTADFIARAAGGLAPYTYQWSGLPVGCTTSDLAILPCTPSRFGLYNVSVEVMDVKGRSATANMTVQVDPASTVLAISSQYAGYFYQGVDLANTFGVVSSVWGVAPTNVSASLRGVSLAFSPVATGWNASAPMGNVTPGASLEVTVTYANWTLHGTLPIEIIETPPWMRSFLAFPGNLLLFRSSATGEWNASYEFADEMGWSLASLIAFSLPVPGFQGAYSLLPSSLAYFNFSSTGFVGMTGQLTTDPSLTFGPVTLSASIPGLKFSSTVNVTGTFSLQRLGPGTSTIDWVSASASLSVSAEADFTISIIPAATPEGSLGLTAEISVAPSIMLTVVLGPGTPGNSNFLPGLSVVMKDLLVQVGVEVGLTIQFGVDNLFEIGAKGTLGLAALFQTVSPHLAGIWVNASVAGFVQFLCFSVSFTLWSGTIYQWTADPSAAPARVEAAPADIFVPWGFASRYYNTTDYNRVVWNGSQPNGTAIQDIYPNAAPVVAGGGPAATIAYTSDNVAKNESSALSLDAYTFDPITRALTPSQLPTVANSVTFSPQVMNLANGSSVAVFSSVPVAEMATRTPGSISGFDLEGTSRSSGAWGAPRLLQDWGYPLSYLLDTCGTAETPTAAVLVAPSVDPNATTPERLIAYDLDSGGIESNVSVTGLTSLGGFDCAGGWVSGVAPSGNVTLVATSTGLAIVVNVLSPTGSTLVGATPVGGASDDVALLYRGPSGEEAIVFDLEPETAVAVATVPGNVTSVAAESEGSDVYLFAGTPDSVLDYDLSGTGAASQLPAIAAPGLARFSVARTTYGLLVLTVPSRGGSTAPIENLSLTYLPLETPPASSPSSASGACAYAGLGCGTADLLFGAVLGALILAGIVFFIAGRTRGRRPPAGEGPGPSLPPTPLPIAPTGPPVPPGPPEAPP